MKDILRKRLITHRESFTKTRIQILSEQIQERVLSLPEFAEAQTIGLYASHRGEVETNGIFQMCKDFHKQICFPVVFAKKLLFRQVTQRSDFIVGTYGIQEPHAICPLVSDSSIDFLIIPCVAVDRAGNRIGWGGGFYDRFLQNNFVLSVCLAYDFQVLPCVASEEHDVSVDMVISPTEVIICGERRHNEGISNRTGKVT